MKSPINVLHLEDDAHAEALVRKTLADDGITCTTLRVDDRDGFVAALERGGIDLVLSDLTRPAFDGMAALALVRARWPDLPVILVSGTLGEDAAVDALKSGATDYVLKDRLARLAPAVRHAMLDVELRAEGRLVSAQLIEAQKMEVVGQLAGGVAHDFNNILAVIIGYADLITTALGPNSPVRRYTEEIRLASERATGLTGQMLVFGRRQRVQPVVLDLNEVVGGLDAMLRRLIDEHIELSIVPGSGLGRVKADAGYVGQVLMNLVVNARDAMPNGGKITISTRNATLDAGYAAAHPGAAPGEYVLLSVADTGTGMTDEVKARLFEPFFTTKPLGKGTGLGLPTCRTIVREPGGYIGVRSELGKGSTFEVYLPRRDEPLDVRAKVVRTEIAPRGTETLLVVEDDPSVRHLACTVLEAQGYRVLRANNGQDGLRVARELGGGVLRLVITDVVMPVMGGKVMTEWLRTSYPDLRILFASGYADDATAQLGALDPGVGFLPKPFSPASLSRKVRELLDAPSAPATT